MIPLLAVMLLAASPAGATQATITLVTPEEPGVRLVVSGTLVGKNGDPVAGAKLHVYQTDATGKYTVDRAMDEPHARLSGVVTTDASGRFEIDTIRPGGYPNAVRLDGVERRIPAHIHMDVSADGYRSRRLQAVFSDDPSLDDPYWSDWVLRLGQPVLTLQPGDPVRASLKIVLE